MELTPQDLWNLRNIVIRAVNEAHEVLAAAARRARQEAKLHPARTTTPPPSAPPLLAPSPSIQLSEKFAFSLKEAGQVLGLSRSTLYKLIGEGRIPTIRVGGRRLIEKTALEWFLADLRPPS